MASTARPQPLRQLMWGGVGAWTLNYPNPGDPPSLFSKSMGLTLCGMVDEPTSPAMVRCLTEEGRVGKRGGERLRGGKRRGEEEP